ncbi:hypothetical protein CCHOA_04105 [Corynebacterium choanae]|uniref:Uncharacterized protein n=1 Tax=Corynebacterium choanae TaxID=1862358 RepID=A0A3G6J9V4_9CORY|nr:hypothetical protein CCHOA_04105 [Corynebacterium choanae]
MPLIFSTTGLSAAQHFPQEQSNLIGKPRQQVIGKVREKVMLSTVGRNRTANRFVFAETRKTAV